MNLFNMKTTVLATSTTVGFICAYFLNLTMEFAEQYLAVVAVMLLDGFFGVIKGMKFEGFQTRKAIKVLKTLFTWILILTVILMIEKGLAQPGNIIAGGDSHTLVYGVIKALGLGMG